MLCNWEKQGEMMACTNCGQTVKYRERLVAACGTQELLGDRIEQGLASMGITKENYASAKEAFGLLPDCNCKGRKILLNEIHTYAKEHGWLKAIAHARTIGKTNDS
jgi:hypothetical protein